MVTFKTSLREILFKAGTTKKAKNYRKTLFFMGKWPGSFNFLNFCYRISFVSFIFLLFNLRSYRILIILFLPISSHPFPFSHAILSIFSKPYPYEGCSHLFLFISFSLLMVPISSYLNSFFR